MGVKCPGIIENRRTLLEFHPSESAVFIKESSRPQAVYDIHPFFKGFFNLVIPGRHFIALFKTHEGHGFRALALGGQGHINSHISAPYHNNPFPHFHGIAQSRIPQKIHSFENAGKVLSGNVQPTAQVQSGP